MIRMVSMIVAACAALSLAACSSDPGGKSYAAPIAEVQAKLADLDLTKNIGSVAYKPPSDVTMDADTDNVTWHINTPSGAKLFDVVAHLTAEGEKQTRVAIEIVKGNAPDPLPPVLGGLRKNVMMERIAAHLEDRRFNDKPYLDMQYSMASPLIPREMIENAKQAQMATAELEGMGEEMAEKAREEAQLRANQAGFDDRPGAPTATARPMTDLSKYNH